MKKKLWLWVGVVVCLIAGGVWWYRTAHAKTPPSYETSEVTRGDVMAKVTSTGTLQAVTKVTVGSQVSGIIETILVDFNSRVRKNQVLAQIDPSLFAAQLNQAQASLNNAEAGYNNAQANTGNALANVRAADAGIATAAARVETAHAAEANARAALDTAKANLARAQAEMVNAKRNFDRFESLLKKDLVAKSERDQAQTQHLVAIASTDSAEAQVEAQRANYRSAQSQLVAARADHEAARIKRESAVALQEAAQAQVASARAQMSQARANVESAEVNVSRTTIRSPIDGIVLARNISVGQTVAAQFQAPDLFTLAENLDQMQVETAVDEADIGKIKVNSKAIFTVDAYPNEDFDGTVISIRQSPTTVQNVVTYQVIVRCVNKGLKLKPGMTATVNIQVDSRKDALLLPNAALRFKPPDDDKGGGSKKEGAKKELGKKEGAGKNRRVSVWMISAADPGKLDEKKVQLGITDGTNTEIVKGEVKEGDDVVTSSGDGEKSGGNRPRMRFF